MPHPWITTFPAALESSKTFNGSVKRSPNIHVNVVDVHDVAIFTFAQMTTLEANGNASDRMEEATHYRSMDMARFYKHHPELAAKLSQLRRCRILAYLKFGALLMIAKEGRLMMALATHVSNQKAKQVLGWKPSVQVKRPFSKLSMP